MKKISTLIILLHCLSLQSQTTIFVNKNVQGGLQNGTSWPNAFPDLQQALAVATDGDDIWVAAATYFPTPTTDRSISFVLKQGVKMYGGFNGTETTQSQRNFMLNETILSGNIGAPGGADNSYHILYGTGVDSTTVVDGFMVSRGGSANSTFLNNIRGGGLYLEPSPNLYNTCPVIQNCRFEYNFAGTGAAVFCRYEFGNVVNPILRNCQFVSNRAADFAGALYKGGPAPPDKPFIVENCLFLKNAAFASEGGGAYLANTGNTTIFRNCIFEKDSARASWGAGLFYAATSSTSRLVLDSCTFKENFGTEGAGFTFTDFSGGGLTFYCDITNCRFEGNKTQNADAAALLILGFTNSKIEANIHRTTFIDNLTYTNTAVLMQGGFNSDINIGIKDCKYINNIDSNNPDGLCFALLAGVGGGESKCRVSIENSLFANNGGGVAVLSAEEADMVTNITNCTFYKNNEFVVGKSWYPSFDTSDIHRNDCYITNCIFWEPGSAVNQMFTNNDFMNVNMYNYFIDHSMVSLTSTNIPGGPEAFGDNVIFGTYPMFVDTTNEDFRLHPCSPAVNKGDNVAVDTIGLIFDLDGNPRIYRDTVDLGAYEVLDSCLTISSKEPNARASIALSPNPVHTGGELFIRLLAEQNPGKLNWTVVDVRGERVGEGFCQNAPIESFSVPAPRIPGVYFLQIQGAGIPIQMKFVVCE